MSKIVYIKEQVVLSSTPSTPDIGYSKLYQKSDGLWYSLDGAGSEELLNSKALGWIQVADSTYTSASPLTVSSNTRTLLPNDGSSILNVTNPIGAASWWSSNKFNPDNSGDSYDLRIQFTADPTLNNRNLTLELDIGGSQGVIWDKTLRLARGAGVNTRITETMDIYTLSTFISNGAEIYITCDGDINIFDIIFKIERKYRA